MFMVVVPRIFTISLMMAYMKEYFLIFLPAFVFISLVINLPHFRRDAPDVSVGILTNLFAPAIVIQEGSGFYKRSSIAASILHILGLICLLLIVLTNFISTCPDTEAKRHAPILHCFTANFSSDFSMERCKWPEKLTPSNCTKSFEDTEVEPICIGFDLLATITNQTENYVTFCGDSIPWWIPLACTSLVLSLLHTISIFLIHIVLCKMLDAIKILKLSRSNILARNFDPVWDESKSEILEPILNFLENPTRETLQQVNVTVKPKTGQDFIGLAIWNDHRKIMKIILDELEEPISHAMVKKVLKCGSPELIKMFLSKEKDLQPCEYFLIEGGCYGC